ncbi:MAG: hypothetical protein WD076_06375 [Parvularculaceae bacterium]
MRVLASLSAAILLCGLALVSASAQEPVKKPPRLCSCALAQEGEILEFAGVAVDAELALDETGQNVLPRQASIFRVIRAPNKELKTPVKVWHSTETAQCGVRFDYGKEYQIRARKEGDRLETDYCLMKDVTQPAP